MPKFIHGILCLALLLCLMPLFAAQARAEEPLALNSGTVIAVSAETGRVLYGQGESDRVAAGCFTKLVTALVVMEQVQLEANLVPSASEMVTVGKEINSLPSGVRRAGLDVGEEISVQNLLYAMLLHGGDDAAIALAAYFGRKALGGAPSILYDYDRVGVEHFVVLMNEKAKRLGMSGSMFQNPCGYSQDGQFTTAGDLAKAAAAFVQYDYLCKITSTLYLQYEDWSAKQAGSTSLRYWENQNPFINTAGGSYDKDCKGLMAGAAGVVAYVERNGFGVIAISLGSGISGGASDDKKLIDYAYANYLMYRPVEAGAFICEQQVKNAMDVSNEHVTVLATESQKYLTRADEVEAYTFERRFYESLFSPTVENINETYLNLTAPIVKGTVLGTMDIYLHGEYVDTVLMYAGETVEAYQPVLAGKTVSWWQKIGVANLIYGAVIVVFVVMIIIFIVRIRHNMRAVRAAKRKYRVGKRAKSAAYSKYKNKK